MKLRSLFAKDSLKTDGIYIMHNAVQGELQAETAVEMVEQLYEISRYYMGDVSFEEWWTYQQNVSRHLFRHRLADYEGERSARKLIKIVIRVGAYTLGRAPRD